jgi:hypothetical protein
VLYLDGWYIYKGYEIPPLTFNCFIIKEAGYF